MGRRYNTSVSGFAYLTTTASASFKTSETSPLLPIFLSTAAREMSSDSYSTVSSEMNKPLLLSARTTTELKACIRGGADDGHEEEEELISSSSSDVNSKDDNDNLQPTPSPISLSVPDESNIQSATGKNAIDIPLLFYFLFFYIFNYGYSMANKLTIKEAPGFPLTISALQLGLGSLYGIFLWLAPEARTPPKILPSDLLKMMPVALCTVGSHSASVFGYAHGSVSFVQIVKAAEPVFAAFLSQFLYNKPVSRSKWFCLPIIIGGVILASVNEVNFSWIALFSACISNFIAAFRGNETKRLLMTDGIKDRIGGAGNQFAITAIMGFLLWTPVAYFREGSLWSSQLWPALITSSGEPSFRKLLFTSAIFYYGYNELRTVTLKKISAVSGSIANTAKRIIVILGVGLALGESLNVWKILGSIIAIFGVLLYSTV